MSADRHAERARARWNASAVPPRASTERSSTVGSSDEPRPAVGGRADLLVVEQAHHRDGPRRAGAVPASASTAAQHEARLSSRADPSSSSSRPTRAPGSRSWSMRSQPRTSSAVTPSSLATKPANPPPSSTVATPHSGVRWCWASTTRPLVVTSRSRWMASWGMAHTGPVDPQQPHRAPVPLRRTATRPDRPRSRSSQLLSSTPP